MKARINRQSLLRLQTTAASASKTWLWDTEIPCYGAYRSSGGQISFV